MVLDKVVVPSGSFLYKMLDDPTDWIDRPYSPIEGGLPSLFHSLKTEIVSHYRDSSWTEEELSFVASASTSHLQAHFQDDFETQAYNPQRFACQFVYNQGVLGHFSTLAPPATTSLAFKIGNLIKVLVPCFKVPLASIQSQITFNHV